MLLLKLLKLKTKTMSFSDSDDSVSNANQLTQEEIDANVGPRPLTVRVVQPNNELSSLLQRNLVDPNIKVDYRDIIGRHQYDRHRRSISRFPDMTEIPDPHLPTNPIVFFDILIGNEFGRYTRFTYHCKLS